MGSLLGPILFSLYVAPLEDVIAQHGCKTVIFADDTQLYISCESSDSVSIIEKCVDEIGKWMAVNFLSLDDVIISDDDSVKNFMEAGSHDYYTYTHSVDVSVFAIGFGNYLNFVGLTRSHGDERPHSRHARGQTNGHL